MPQAPGPHAPHVDGEGHEPHEIWLPHPSPWRPQLKPSSAHVLGVQGAAPQTPGPPPPHTWDPEQVPQLSNDPHVSSWVPQL
jgi:hypothetical protein